MTYYSSLSLLLLILLCRPSGVAAHLYGYPQSQPQSQPQPHSRSQSQPQPHSKSQSRPQPHSKSQPQPQPLLQLYSDTYRDTSFYRERFSELFLTIASETGDSRRRLLSDSLVILTREYLSEKFPFTHTYNNIRYMGYYISPDSMVKMITWNVPFNDGSNSYTCFIVRPSDEGNIIHLIRGERGTAAIGQEERFTPDEWYGALYYDIIPFTHNGRVLYLLPGIDMNDLYTNGKVIEVMGFTDDGTPWFGEQVIRSGDALLSRMVFRYSSNSAMMLRHDPLTGWMVFDHLSPAEPRFNGIYSYYGPDSSYDALELRGEEWFHISDVDLRNRQ